MDNLTMNHVQAVISGARDYNNKAYGDGSSSRALWNELHALYNDISDTCYKDQKPPTLILDDLIKEELAVFEMWNDHRLNMTINNKPPPNFEEHVKDLSELEASWGAMMIGLTEYHPVLGPSQKLFEASGDVRDVQDAFPARVTARNLGIPFTDPGPMMIYRGTSRMLQMARKTGLPIISRYSQAGLYDHYYSHFGENVQNMDISMPKGNASQPAEASLPVSANSTLPGLTAEGTSGSLSSAIDLTSDTADATRDHVVLGSSDVIDLTNTGPRTSPYMPVSGELESAPSLGASRDEDKIAPTGLENV